MSRDRCHGNQLCGKLKILLMQKYLKGIRQRIKVQFNVGRNCRLCICRYTAQNVRSFLNSVFHLQSPGTFAKILLFFTSVFAILHSLTVIKEAKNFRTNNVRITGVFCYICLRIATKNLSSWTDNYGRHDTFINRQFVIWKLL